MAIIKAESLISSPQVDRLLSEVMTLFITLPDGSYYAW